MQYLQLIQQGFGQALTYSVYFPQRIVSFRRQCESKVEICALAMRGEEIIGGVNAATAVCEHVVGIPLALYPTPTDMTSASGLIEDNLSLFRSQ